MSGIVSASDSRSEPENDLPQPVPDQDRSPEAFDNGFHFDFRDIASESDMDRSPGAIDTAEGTVFEEEYRSTDAAMVPSEREIAIAALSKLANESTTSHTSRLPYSTDGPSPIKAYEDYYTIQDLVDHRIDPSDPTRVQIRVKWVDLEIQTWEDEWRLQEDAARTLYAYWRSEGGRCCALNLGPDAVYHVFRVLASRGEGAKRQFKCQWVGYPAPEQQCSWESEAVVKVVARDALAAYSDRFYEFQ
ncbi:hypothetical protein MRS44_011320 [Fusarium solani]|uniref:Chromo domain-containing protein n=1 Tax=Fusarium solani TaxID=169388 RepID=A0A9P9R7X4_FUSSL|nr:uncharacterized protein B0J15DRAFT_486673 [Fusarium solani]KAH7268405.1 hypothetical protein B0J15DRAFT_486673 [Fusarium solani]KAJ3460453.1 hypothetical protein MRS44_011320 [Fusarium solani]